ncbi:hypothetical protein JHK86_004836 [Glycine max]|nr:hypothetical protein JHK86_004836 [Glycine max]
METCQTSRLTHQKAPMQLRALLARRLLDLAMPKLEKTNLRQANTNNPHKGPLLECNLSSNSMQHSMSEFTSLKAFAIHCHPPKASSIHQVNWNSLILGWIKCNTDRATRWCPSRAGCGGIFRNLRLYIVGGFVESLGIKNSIFAKLMELLKLLRLPILKTRRNHGLNMTLSLLSMR